MHIKLWNSPFNGGWIWFERKYFFRFCASWRKDNHQLFICGFGLHVKLILQSWPWHGKRWPKHFKNRNGEKI